ncbi:oxidoreductase [Clostridium paraputrificum]|uniref:oxidoreductase n=1 Tax=Clostridium paraputrificum TaxID=29363 RepID=UPI003D335186
MLKIGYIGNGKSVNRYHLPFVMQRKNIKVKTIYNRDVVNVKWKKIEGINYTSNLDELMNDDEIQMIVVCTMQKFHYEYAKMALEHGKNVLVEKPFMMTYDEAKEIFDLAKEKGLLVQCYQNRRYDSDFLTVQKVIESGKLGDLLEIEMHFDYYRPETPEASKEFLFYDSYLYGHGCHTIDQVVSYFGKPEKVNYDVRCLLGPNKMSDYFDLDLFYGNLKVSVKSSYFRIKRRPSFIVYGKKGMFIKETPDRQEEHLKLFYMPGNEDFGVDNFEHYGTITYMDDDGIIKEEKVPSEVGDYGRVYDELYATIVEGKEPVVKDEETLCVMKILETGARMAGK